MRCGAFRPGLAFLVLTACLVLPACNNRGPGFGAGIHGDGGFKNGVSYSYAISWVTRGSQPCFVLVADGCGGVCV